MKEIRNIVVPTDFSPLAEAAVERAVGLARVGGAAIHLVHAYLIPVVMAPYEFTVPQDVWEGVRRTAQDRLEQVRKAVEAKGVRTVSAQIVEFTDAVGAITAAVKAHEADLVVMGTHGYGGLKHAFLGSVAERALRIVDRPILAVKGDREAAAKPIEKILLAVDFSPHSDRAVEAAEGLAARLPASVDVIHAFDLPRDYNPYLSTFGVELEKRIEAEASERLERVRERLEQRGIRVGTHFRRGVASAVIAEAAQQIGCQLIVMGTRGMSGLSHVLLGSVAERTLRAAPCSVLCVKAKHDRADA
jgi:nucleotide-binding universal stress UspA family protein